MVSSCGDLGRLFRKYWPYQCQCYAVWLLRCFTCEQVSSRRTDSSCGSLRHFQQLRILRTKLWTKVRSLFETACVTFNVSSTFHSCGMDCDLQWLAKYLKTASTVFKIMLAFGSDGQTFHAKHREATLMALKERLSVCRSSLVPMERFPSVQS